MRSDSSFSTLPPEVICRIFEFVEDFSVLAALARTARIFYQNWRENPTTICRVVAPRVIFNLTDAERLLDMQENVEPRSQDGFEQNSITRAKRLIFNARCAAAAGDNWVNLLRIHESTGRGEHLGEDPHMRPSELARFEHAFYCVWTIGVMAKTPHLQDQASTFLRECSPRELCRLDEFAMWARDYNDNDFGPSGFDLEDEVWKAGCDLVSKRWWDYRDGKQIVAPHDTPIGFYAFFDHTQRFIDMLPDGQD